MSPKFIIADEFIAQVCRALAVDFERTSRVIIDARVGYATMAYVEMLGTDELLTFEPRRISGPILEQAAPKQDGEAEQTTSGKVS